MYENDLFSRRFVEQTGRLVEFAGLLQDIPEDGDPIEIVERRIGRNIQAVVQEYYHQIPVQLRAARGRVSVGENVVLDLSEIELYRSPRLRIGHSIGNPPLLPEYWLRNYQGIRDFIVRGRFVPGTFETV